MTYLAVEKGRDWVGLYVDANAPNRTYGFWLHLEKINDQSVYDVT